MRFADPSSVRDQAPGEPENERFDAPTPHTPPTEEMPESDGVDLTFLDPPLEQDEIGRIAHYRVLSIIGVGGMGVVLRGEDTHLRRPVALKVMRKEYVESYASRERFLQEARVVAAVESENIVTIYQVGMHNDVPFLAMQFLHGEALDERLNRQVPLPVPFALLIARQTATGLADAHAHGLVHRDIKPANIWLETDPASGKFRRVRLLDFGLARIIDSNRKLTSMGVIVGTPQYMSPEQAFGSEVDGRADLFSLGAVMYAMFTGTLPFEGKTSAATLMALVSHNPPRVSTMNRQVPGEVDELIERLLAKEPEKRPATADEVVEILDSVLIEFSAPILGRTSGVLGYATRDTFPGTRTTPPPPVGGKDFRGLTVIGPQPTLTLIKPQVESAPSPVTAAVEPAPSAIMPMAEAKVFPATEHAAVLPPSPPVAIAPVVSSHPPAQHRTHAWANVVGWGILLTLTTLMAFGVIGQKSAPLPVTVPIAAAPQDIHVGLLYAKTGAMAALEQSQADATMLAIDEINQRGGLLGKKIVPVEVDAGQTPEEHARQAELLIKERGVTTLFGCPASADRRTVLPLVERYKAALFCPGTHEGMENSARIVYVGPTASQSVAPAIKQLLAKGPRKFFVVGKDDVYSRAIGAVVQDTLKDVPGASLEGEVYMPASTKLFTPVLDEIRAKQPDVIVNAVQGGGSVVFVQQLRSATPSISSRVLHLQHLEDFDRAIEPAALAGDWMTCSYLATEPEAKAEGFATRFDARFGASRTATDSMAAAYTAVQLWAQAVESAGSENADSMLAALPKVEVSGPFGTLKAAETGRHFRFPLLIPEFGEDGTLNVVHRTGPLDPQIYPPSRAGADWDRTLRQMYFRWGERWRGPDGK